MKLETKNFTFAPIHQTKKEGSNANILTGIASTFGGSPDLQGDVIHRQAFDGSLLRFKAGLERPQFLLMHRADQLPIGKILRLEAVSANQLPPSIRQKGADGGLLIEAEYFNSPNALAALEAAWHGVLSLSIGFQTVAASDIRVGGKMARQLEVIDLKEVSVVTFPANTLATANVATVKRFPLKKPAGAKSALSPAMRRNQMRLNAVKLFLSRL